MLRPSPHALSAHLEGQAVILNTDTKAYVRLNEMGAEIWKEIEGGIETADLVERLGERFDAEEAVIRADVEDFLQALRTRKLLDEG